MKDIIIKCDENSGFLRTEAMTKAIEFEEYYMAKHKEGHSDGMIWKKLGTQSEWQFYVYHTKTAIVVRVDKIK